MKKIIQSYDEEYEPSFAERAGHELEELVKKYCEENKINLCNEEVIIIIDFVKH